MNFDDFTVIDFPPINREISRFVYVLFYLVGNLEVPFYVGQTGRIWGRLDDYYWAAFTAATDFRVGEAIRHLGAKNILIRVKYKSISDSKAEEASILNELRKEHYRLLNDMAAYDYTTAEQDQERLRVCQFVDELLAC